MRQSQKLWLAAAVLLALGVSAFWWLPRLASFVRLNSDTIQGWEALVALVMLAGSGLTFLLGRRARQEEARININSGGGAIVPGAIHTGGGDFVGRDKITIQQGKGIKDDNTHT